MEVRWTEHAYRDLKGIHDHILLDSANAARAVAERLWEAVWVLSRFPDSGRIVPERANPAIRELILPPYRLVYRRRGELVEIVTIFHASRQFPRKLPGDAG